MSTEKILEHVRSAYLHQPTFIQAVTEFLESIIPYLESTGASDADYALLQRLLVPERVISFKVVWEDDKGELQHNVGYRIQFNSALGPYKGGLRFDASVNEDVLKFLGFEQIFKNALTGLPLGGGKGGSDFNSKGKSDREIRRFSTAFMTELSRHIGAYTDVPAGDIGVGGKEIGYLYGAYKQLVNRADGALTGKGVGWGGSEIRTEATGYGAVYFVKHMLAHVGKEMGGMKAVVSGSGNVALHAAEKLIAEGAQVLTLSDRGGYVYAPEGMSQEFVEEVKRAKENDEALASLALPSGMTYYEGKPWKTVTADIYIPCATQNEFDETDAEAVIAAGGTVVAEGANMPLTLEAVHRIQKDGVLYAPGKAVNAGGVAVSGLEMSQNATHCPWTREVVDEALQNIMDHIHRTCVHYGAHDDGGVDYVKGANIGGFVRVLGAMKQLGW